MRIAIIADIHGNMPALEAVLADIQRRGVDRTINLGDSVSGPLWPREVCDLLMASSSLVIRGNHDRWVSGPDPASMGPSDRYAHSNLGADHRHWLGALAISADAGNGILACHGTPTNDNQYLIEEVSRHHLVRAHPSTIRERLGDVQARVVLCGHSHQQHLIQLPDGPLILNPGSVGCPSYDDPGAEPHVSDLLKQVNSVAYPGCLCDAMRHHSVAEAGSTSNRRTKSLSSSIGHPLGAEGPRGLNVNQYVDIAKFAAYC